MLNIFAKTYLTATRTTSYNPVGRHTRYDTRRFAGIATQKPGGRRD